MAAVAGVASGMEARSESTCGPESAAHRMAQHDSMIVHSDDAAAKQRREYRQSVWSCASLP
eukprot:5194794-Prymnesium_polylepis.1